MERDNNKNVSSTDMNCSGQQQRRHTVSYGGAHPPAPGSNRDAYKLIRPRLPVPQIQTYAYLDHHPPTAMNHGYAARMNGMPQMGNQLQHHRHFLPSMREVNFYRDSQQILPPPVIAAAPTYLPPWQNFFGLPYGVDQKSAESYYNKNKQQQQQQQQQLLGPVRFDAKHPGGESLVPHLTPLKHDAIPSRKRFYREVEPLASASDCVDDENNSGVDCSGNIVSADSVSLPSEESKSPGMYRAVAVSDERAVKHLRLASSPDSLCDHQNENNSEHCNVEQQLEDKSCDTSKSSKRDLKDSSCPTCGKVYKNQSCLAKHIWEHHESWKYVKTLLLNKHQSVQVMEAAQTLLNFNQDAAELRSLSRYEGSESGEFDTYTVNSV
ncbi:hypothetical protein MIR68_012147 [Amoeboaphelidium protococcarum]|nr:hypothetical protein MIR68_012147 [Amoeboaphelidium protococcarum]